jgi:hypothetical protein
MGVMLQSFLLLGQALWMHPKIHPSKPVMARGTARTHGPRTALPTPLLPPFTLGNASPLPAVSTHDLPAPLS